jgi:hypothetical protein
MANASTSAISEPAFRFTGRPGGLLVLRLSVQSRMAAPAVVHPALDDWVDSDGRIFPAELRAAPSYTYLQQGSAVRLTLSTVLPGEAEPGDFLRSVLRFPGIEEEVLPVVVEMLDPKEAPDSSEHQISVTLPLAGYDSVPGEGDEAHAKAIVALLAGLAGLEVIPARWVVSELIVTVCEVGERYREAKDGRAFLDRLERTRFYKNGALAFRGAHIMEWIMVGVTVSSGLYAVFGGEKPRGRMLHAWERWLLNLIDMDIEWLEEEEREVRMPPPRLEETLERLGTDSERWFSSFILGLTQLSPRIRDPLLVICEQVPGPPEGAEGGPEKDDTPENDVLSEGGSLLK